MGRAALLYMFARVNEKKDKTFEDLMPFTRFGWLLNEEEKQAVKDWTAALAKTVVAKASGPALRSGSAAASSSEIVRKEAPKKRKATDETVLRAAAKALFRTYCFFQHHEEVLGVIRMPHLMSVISGGGIVNVVVGILLL